MNMLPIFSTQHRLNTSKPMKKALNRLLVAATTLHASIALNAQIAVPATLNYQGALVDSGGNPLANGNTNVVFALYDAASAGALLWGPVTNPVALFGGSFNTTLGPADSQNRTLAGVIAAQAAKPNSPAFLELTVGTNVGAARIQPRQQLLSAPYAYAANTANTAITANTANTANTAITATSVSGAGTITAANLAPSIGIWSTNGSSIFRLGNVGIGTNAPGAKLDVVGSARIRPEPESTGLHLMSTRNNTEPLEVRFYKSSGTGDGHHYGAVGFSPTIGTYLWAGSGSTAALRIHPVSGFVGVGLPGNSSAESPLHIQGVQNRAIRVTSQTGKWWTIGSGDHNDNGVLYFLPGSGTGAYIDQTNGQLYSNSDRSLKKDITPLGTVLDRILQLAPVTYRFKTSTDTVPKSYGFIAQEVEPLFPDIVSESLGKKSLSYDSLIPVAIGGIQELNEKLEGQLRERDQEITELRRQVAALEASRKADREGIEALAKRLTLLEAPKSSGEVTRVER